ncbi:hypothetical protein ANRL2_00349 [Anaerolineae bacterium]|nr:hypothetical protein ANRL2_00349 [Anaerolineae bacterium]
MTAEGSRYLDKAKRCLSNAHAMLAINLNIETAELFIDCIAKLIGSDTQNP